MSGRSMRARIERLGIAVNAPAPECRNHGRVCAMGADWPQPYIHDQEDELFEWLAEVRGGMGPSRRERWVTHVHERVPAAEIAQRNREVAEAVAEAHAKNERILADLIAEREERP